MIMRGRFILLTALWLALPAAADAPPPPPAASAPASEASPPANDSAMEPQITITHRGQTKIEEYRINGRMYMIKVTPRHGKPYYLMPRPNGRMMRFNDLSPNFVVPMWMIKEF